MEPLAHPNLLRNKLSQEMRLSLVFLAVLALLPLGVSSPYWLARRETSKWSVVISRSDAPSALSEAITFSGSRWFWMTIASG